MPNWFRTLSIAALLAVAASFSTPPAISQTVLLNVSYDPTRELYQDINRLFAKEWQEKTGETIAINTSHGGSGKQARSVIDGLAADIVTLALAGDIDEIAKVTGKIPADWQKRLPHNSTPYSSTIVFLVRKGNPKAIKDWDDLIRPDVQIITPNPKTSGGARWNYLAAWGYAMKLWNDEAKAKDFVKAIFKNVVVLDTGARAATMTFTQRAMGDVLIAWENEALLSSLEAEPGKFEIITPSISILAEPAVSIVDKNVDRRNTRKAAEAYLNFLYTQSSQAIIAKHFFRPANPDGIDPKALENFPKLQLLKIDQDFGGWAAANAKHFAQNALFDLIMKENR